MENNLVGEVFLKKNVGTLKFSQFALEFRIAFNSILGWPFKFDAKS